MTKKKRKPRNRQTASRPSPPQGATGSQTAPRSGGADPARRARKEAARKAREAARKKQTRVSFARRAIVIAVVTVVSFTTLYFLEKAASPRPISAEAIAAAKTAGCTDVQTPVADGSSIDRHHLNPGESFTYTQHPATSGPHDPSPLPVSPDIYTEPVPETNAVHFLEHAGVIIYYRQTGDGALKQDVVDALGKVADVQPNTLLAPYPDLPDGVSLALTAWNRLQTCPATVSAADASTIADGFAHAFVCTSVAPEPKNSDDC